MDRIRIALAQICAAAGKTEENAEKIMRFMEEASKEGAELAVFPECSLTGYAPELAERFALSEGCESIATVEKTAERLGIAVCFGFMERRPEGLYIAQELFSGKGRLVYRKTHLGSKEALHFKAGSKFPAAGLPVKGGSVLAGMQLCWESHIPQISAAYRSQGAQLLLFPYASGMSGEKARENWSIHLPARASDNGCFAAACNLITERKGPGGETLRLGGGMAAWDPKGRLIAEDFSKDEKLLFFEAGGPLPREEKTEDMHSISYFDRVRTELF